MEKEIRPWGDYVVIAENNYFKTKVITINPNSRLSLQKHKKRAEHWYILDGTATVTVNDRVFDVVPGDEIHVKIGDLHRIESHDQTVRFVEVQTGGIYFGEDDIIRLEDDYGRTNE